MIYKTAFKNLFRRKLRTFLSIMSIAIGLALLFILLSVVAGIKEESINIVSKIKGVIVYSNSVVDPSFGTIDESYENKIKKIRGVKLVIPEYYFFISKIDNKDFSVSSPFSRPHIYATNAEYINKGSASAFIDKIVSGRSIKKNDKRKILLPKDMADDFKKRVGDSIKIDSIAFKIIGIYDNDSELHMHMVIMDKKTFLDYFDYPKGKVNAFFIVPKEYEPAKNISKKIEFTFPELQAKGQEALQDQINSILLALSIISFVVSFIASIVAGIGILNTMYMSVQERYKEIATLRAVGWTKKNIMHLILSEAFFISIFGFLFSMFLAFIFFYFLKGIPFSFNLSYFMLILFMSFALSIIASYMPARKAANMQIVDAIREE